MTTDGPAELPTWERSGGWCNRALARTHFFPALEASVAAVTGLVPRGDEQPAPLGPTCAAADRT